MLIWHVCLIIAVKALRSGRAAILAYTMPVFSAVIGARLFHAALTAQAWLDVAAAALGVLLLLWHELTGLAGSPAGVRSCCPRRPPGPWARNGCAARASACPRSR
jgi:drug/metabolite transporter (DMT)-like permease